MTEDQRPDYDADVKWIDRLWDAYWGSWNQVWDNFVERSREKFTFAALLNAMAGGIPGMIGWVSGFGVIVLLAFQDFPNAFSTAIYEIIVFEFLDTIVIPSKLRQKVMTLEDVAKVLIAFQAENVLTSIQGLPAEITLYTAVRRKLKFWTKLTRIINFEVWALFVGTIKTFVEKLIIINFKIFGVAFVLITLWTAKRLIQDPKSVLWTSALSQDNPRRFVRKSYRERVSGD